MKMIPVLCFTGGLAISAVAQLTFSEVMFDPATDENHDEYVEILNLSRTDSADLSGCLFSDGQGVDEILPFGPVYKIPPEGYALLMDGSYPGNSATYDSILTQGIRVYVISDRAFGSNGLSNSKGECLSLIDAGGDTIAAYCYTAGNEPGYPDEKILPDGPDSQDNWRDGVIFGGTPGLRNSVSPYDFDIGFEEPGLILPPFISNHAPNHIRILIGNYGIFRTGPEVRLRIYIEHPYLSLLDTLFEAGEDRMAVDAAVSFSHFPAGEYLIKLILDYAQDQNPANNSLERPISLYQTDNSLVINEIKFLTDDGEPEWLELLNDGFERLYLKGWMIADARDTVRIDTAVYIEPAAFRVIAAGPMPDRFPVHTDAVLVCRNLPNLNNDSDEVVLIRPDGSWHERVRYSETWLQDEVALKPSLERISPKLYSNNARNWGPCVAPARGTPGRHNSILTVTMPPESGIAASPNPFSPDGDGREDVTVISGHIPDAGARLRISIYDIRGRLIRKMVENRFTGSHFDVVWDGRDDDGRTARIGIYLIYARVIDDLAGILRELRTTVVLAKPL